jgi:hypothetical protein
MEEAQLKLKTQPVAEVAEKSLWELAFTLRPHKVKSQVDVYVGGTSFQYNTSELSQTWMPSLEVLKSAKDSHYYLLGFGMSDQKINVRTPSDYLISAQLRSYEGKIGWLYKQDTQNLNRMKVLYGLQWVEYLVMQTSSESLGQWQDKLSLGRFTTGIELNSFLARVWLQTQLVKSHNLESDLFNFEVGYIW